MIEYKAKNQYNYTILAIQIDYVNKKAVLYHGQTAPLHKMKKASAKKIRELWEVCKTLDFSLEEV